MPCRTLPRLVAIATVAAALLPIASLARTPQPGELAVATSLSGIYQFDTDLDHGGNFRWAGGIASGSVTHQLTSRVSVGATLRYDFEEWRFRAPVELGGIAPWNHLNAPGISLNSRYVLGPHHAISVSPVFGWAFESGAKTSDALTYGAIVSGVRVISPTLTLGVGAGVIRQIDETKVFPFFIVNWQIDDRWRLENPFPAGPAGGAGLELTFTANDHWEFAAGGAKRSSRYRLDDTGVAPGGIGENRYFPLFARVARNFGARTRLDVYAGVALRGRLLVADADGTTIAKDEYSTAPLIGLTFAHRF